MPRGPGLPRLTLALYSNMTAVRTLLNNLRSLNGASMDVSSPDPGAAERVSKQASSTASSDRAVEYGVAAGIVVTAVVISPVAIWLLMGRLNFRPLLLSATFDLFLLLVAGAALARGRA